MTESTPMETKILEIRDRATFIPVMAIRLQMYRASHPAEAWLLRRAGYAEEDILSGRFIILVTLNGGVGKAVCDPYDWGSNTLTPAHSYIAENWDALRPGQTIDAEFIRGESTAPKTSERHSEYGAG